jgi:beta-glucuronidase
VIISEFGAGAIYGDRKPNRAKWTEEYQRDVLDESLRVYLSNPDVVGAVIWQFCDVRVTDGWWKARPRSMNNKGIVDEYRRPKLAYDTVKRRMLEAKH